MVRLRRHGPLVLFACQTPHLPAVLDALGEDAVLVADAVAVGGQSDGGHGVEEAGGQPAQAAVTQAGVLLDVLQLLNVQAHLVTRSQVSVTPGQLGRKTPPQDLFSIGIAKRQGALS